MDEVDMGGADIAVRSGREWRSLDWGADAPTLAESSTLHLRGFAPGEPLSLGPFTFAADREGCLSVRLLTEASLRGHLGLVEVRRASGLIAGEVEIVADKTSQEGYRILRSALERVWARLIFDPDSVSSLQAGLPSPVELWKAIESPVREIAGEPSVILARGEGVRRLESVRKPLELTAGVMRAAPLQRAGRSRVIIRSVDTPESALVAETLRRLAFYARRHPEGSEVAARAGRMLREQPYASCSRLRGGVDAARLRTLHDARYRRVDKVLRVLNSPEAHATEGPGAARLGVKGMIRLYEYWVFLQVLEACLRRYGPPVEPGFRILRSQSRSGTARLRIPEGATVSFPGDVVASFEPRISTSGRGWQRLEYVPHPDSGRAAGSQRAITPDVVVLRRGACPALVVFDAKYVGRRWVDYESAKIHARYARIRLRGTPVVRNVLAAHPHPGKGDLWAGYGSVPVVPGESSEIDHLLP